MRHLGTRSKLGSGATSQDKPTFSEDRVSEIIREELIEFVWRQLREMCGSIKTAMVDYFDERYATIVETVGATASTAVTSTRGGANRAF